MTITVNPSRRTFLNLTAGAGLAATSCTATSSKIPTKPKATAATLATNEGYWARIAAFYDVTGEITNLENGYWGVMASPVKAAYMANIERINRENTHYVRGTFRDDIGGVYERLASFLNVSSHELLLTRNATEALQILIGGYSHLKSGDAVLYSDLDYSAMKSAMDWLTERRGVEVIRITLPEPATRDGIINAYEKAFTANPNIRMALVTHVNNLTGLIHPVKEITTLAKSHDVDVILDSAHAIGQIDFSITDLGADFIGMNLHKWIGAPIGCGLIYIRKDRVQHIDRYMNEPGDEDDIRARAHLGAHNFAAHLTIPDALDFHEAIGASAKEARLRYLRNLWVFEARNIPSINILTPDDPDMVAAMTSFRLQNRKTKEENNAIVRELLETHGVFTVRRTGPTAGDCVRVTPAVYNSAEDALQIATALRGLS